MYIRKVNKSTAKAERYVYRLCESYRTANGPRQKNILTLPDFDVPQERWKELADAIEAQLTGQSEFFTSNEIQSLAEHYASLIQEKQLSEERSIRVLQEPKQSEYETVDINSLQNKNILTIGAEYVALSAYRDLQLDLLFRELGFNEYQQNVAALSIIGRLVQPGSESATRDWGTAISGLGHLLNYSFDNLANNSLYRIADKIYEHKEAIENHLQKREKHLFNLQEKIVLYDLTNTYFEGRMLSNPKAAFGRSKEKRSDCKLMTLGLIIDEAGFPKRSKVMEGNQSEPNSLIGMIALLENKSFSELEESKGIKKHKTIVMDAGIATQENLIFLQEYGYDYICVARTAPIPETMIQTENLIKIKETKKTALKFNYLKMIRRIFCIARVS